MLYFLPGAVRRNPACKRPTESDFRVVCAEWLRLAYDRNGGRKARALKKKKEAVNTDVEHDMSSSTSKAVGNSDIEDD